MRTPPAPGADLPLSAAAPAHCRRLGRLRLGRMRRMWKMVSPLLSPSPQSQHTLLRPFRFRHVTPSSLSPLICEIGAAIQRQAAVHPDSSWIGRPRLCPCSLPYRAPRHVPPTFRTHYRFVFLGATHTFAHSSLPRAFPITQPSRAFLPAAYRIPYIPISTSQRRFRRADILPSSSTFPRHLFLHFYLSLLLHAPIFSSSPFPFPPLLATPPHRSLLAIG
ncbi:hypothetical protein B0H13DRAFT_871453 [Mycena leptocephala]|nr:hypothetical protein B0H13DRAFT_871453 [Mycena leptocephala]